MNFIDSFVQFILPYSKEITAFSYVVLGFGVFQNIIYLLQIPLAFRELIRLRRREHENWRLMKSDISLPISIIIPAYNEEVTICETVLAAQNMQYPKFEVIVVNDGSKDKTAKVLIKEFNLKKVDRFYGEELEHAKIIGVYASEMYPNLIFVDKENGGRSDAINTGIVISRNPLFCTLDADSLLDPEALLSSVRPFIEDPERIVATGGTVRIINGSIVEDGSIKDTKLSRKVLPLMQVMEYIRAFLMGRLSWSSLGMVMIISGAFAVFRRDMAIAVGGFNTKTIGEDFDLVVKMHRYCREQKMDYKMRFVPDPVCWTEAPETLKVLANQRIRWQQGGLEVIFRNIKMLFNPKYGRIGMVAFPLMFIIDVLGPVVELASYILVPIFYFTGMLNTEFMLLFLGLFFVLGIFISMMSLVMEEISLQRFKSAKSLVIMALMAIIENFGYRQLNSIWRIKGWWRFLRKKQVWGEMTRVKREK